MDNDNIIEEDLFEFTVGGRIMNQIAIWKVAATDWREARKVVMKHESASCPVLVVIENSKWKQ